MGKDILFCSSEQIARWWVATLNLEGCKVVQLSMRGWTSWVVIDPKGRTLRKDREFI